MFLSAIYEESYQSKIAIMTSFPTHTHFNTLGNELIDGYPVSIKKDK